MYNLVLIHKGKELIIYNSENLLVMKLEKEKHIRGQRPGLVEIRDAETGETIE
ncbi:hypothetical protein GGQ74_000152 [Desulfobaculum xiamenense]|uniref:Uncharacterized protein n=1 Tax=Desulfobaculum xiamenense TaxID=995050 RepID=A0A846QJ62_9BACT|nr:hypothetical protein [Desulfobaculum xiamenense]NJB66512.1 hypothetical protein [Desulfobaculum xiamenense]